MTNQFVFYVFLAIVFSIELSQVNSLDEATQGSIQSKFNEKIGVFLRKRFQRAKEELSSSFSTKQREKRVPGLENVSVQFEKTSSETLNSTTEGDGIILSTPHDEERLYLLHSNRLHISNTTTNSFEFLAHIDLPDSATFIETFTLRNKTLILIGSSAGYCKVFLLLNSSGRAVQTIRVQGKPTAARLFWDRRLYAVIINKKDNTSKAKLYVWTGTYFDEEESFEVSQPYGVLSFQKEKNETIIVIAQNSREESPISTVFRLKNEKLEKLQYLSLGIQCHNCFAHFNISDAHFVVSGSDVYRWEESRSGLFKWIQIPLQTDLKYFVNIFVGYSEKQPLLFFTLNNSILAFDIHSRTFGEVWSTSKQIIATGIINNSIKFAVITKSSDLFTSCIYRAVVKFPESEILSSTRDPIYTCFSTLRDLLDSQQKNINWIEEQNSWLLLTDVPIKYDGVVHSNHETVIHKGSIGNKELDSKQSLSPTLTIERIVDLQVKLQHLNNDIEHLLNVTHKDNLKKLQKYENIYIPENSGKTEPVDPHTPLHGADNVPHKWIDPRRPRLQKRQYNPKTIVVKNLKIAPGNIFDDVLLKSGTQHITGRYKIDNLRAFNMIVAADIPINGIELGHAVVNSDFIKGVKRCNNLYTEAMHVQYINTKSDKYKEPDPQTHLSDTHYQITYVKDLKVKTLNGENFDDFVSSLYIKGKSSVIQGNMILQGQTKISSLSVGKINNVEVTDLLTKDTDQEIYSEVYFRTIYAVDFEAETVNNEEFGDNIAIKGQDNIILGPVKIDNLTVTDNLTLSEESEVDRQFIGTKEEDLLQMYMGKVKIIGSLTIHNLRPDHDSKFIINKQKFNFDLPSTYWMKSVDQIINTSVALTGNVMVTQISADYINEVPWRDIALIDSIPKENLYIYFQDAIIEGHITINPKAPKSKPSLSDINKEAVRISGRYKITGKKIFPGNVGVRKFKTNMLNNASISDFILRSDEQIHFTGTLKIKTLKVKTINSRGMTTIGSVNNISLTEFFSTAFMIDETTHLQSLNFKNVRAQDLELQYVNGVQTSDLASMLLEGHDQISNMTITGNVTFSAPIKINTVNGIDLNEYLNLVVSATAGGQIGGHKVFASPLTVYGNIEVEILGEIDLQEMFDKALSRTKPQNITEFHTFSYLTTDLLFADEIDGVLTSKLIDVTNSSIRITSPLLFNNLYVEMDVVAKTLPFELNVMEKSLHEVPPRLWKYMQIEKNTFCHLPNSKINKLLTYAVTTKSVQNITGKVHFDGSVSAQRMFSVTPINGIDLQAMHNDCLKLNGQEQIVMGRKSFLRSTWISEVECLADFKIPVINNINIKTFNSSLVLNNEQSFISGHKHFTGKFAVDYFHVINGSIHGVDPNYIVFANSNRTIPKTYFKNFTVTQDMKVSYVNDIHLNSFLESRVRLTGLPQNISSNIRFENLRINGSANINSINLVPLNAIVQTTNCDEVQEISGKKIFSEDIYLYGPIDVEILNNHNLLQTYNSALFKHEDVNLDSDVVFKALVTFEKGLHAEKLDNDSWMYWKFNNVPYTSPYLNLLDVSLSEGLEKIHNQPTQYLYIEPSDIKIPLPPIYKVTPIKDLLFTAWGSSPGTNCGLSYDCKCPAQYTVDFADVRHVEVRPENVTSRTISLFEKGTAINIYTNAISTSAECRLPAGVEYSSISWLNAITSGTSSPPWGDIHVNSQRIRGYISDTKSFRFTGKTFVVLARYFDVQYGTYDVDSLLVELDSLKNSIKIIQNIPTQGAKALEIFETFNETYLVICNEPPVNNTMGRLEMYKFNTEKLQFKRFEAVPCQGCNLITSAVFKNENLIIFGSSDSHDIHIIRYHIMYSSYYYYQTITFEAPIRGLHVYYLGAFGASDAQLCVTTADGNFFVYAYTHIQGWKLVTRAHLQGAQGVTSFSMNFKRKLFMASTDTSRVLSVIAQGQPEP